MFIDVQVSYHLTSSVWNIPKEIAMLGNACISRSISLKYLEFDEGAVFLVLFLVSFL